MFIEERSIVDRLFVVLISSSATFPVWVRLAVLTNWNEKECPIPQKMFEQWKNVQRSTFGVRRRSK